MSPAPTAIDMAIFRQYIAPLLVVLVFLVALVAVSARIFLPSDMAAPAPIEEVTPQPKQAQLPTVGLPPKKSGRVGEGERG
jgi:hypothetical protein